MIRWRQQGDDKSIVALVRTQLVPISPWQHPRDSRLHYEITRRLRRGATLVAARSRRSTPFGFLHMEFRGTTLFIDLLAVDSTAQNKHWGTELMARAEQYGRKKGCTISQLFVDEGNTRALRFYHRLGYQTLRTIYALKVIELVKPLNYF
ncbi:GNAT family N-acetyltransferase [Cohnella silvisoli]|uniref:GNAT family N-acetyltransferase n=1 Tax=Cohnella silvisoli TaxID=2873699 RepID=A0ABV1KXC7_9BACL|nr:GNAT family N-acetyltransferase [Cohnella silvisoli]MCD9024143.1 GNAT family N-acetyltransferase [Cohnella silvisoli]